MDRTVRVQFVGGAAVVALGIVASLVTSTVVASKAYVTGAKERGRTAQEITVKGSARLRVRSDLGVWTITVKGEAETLPEAYDRLASGVESVTAFLSARGFAPETVTLSAIDTSTHYQHDKDGRETRKVEGYTLDRTVTVRSPDVDRFASAAADATGLLKQGVVLVSGWPSYLVTQAGDLKAKIVGDASADARYRADQVAERTGCHVTEVRHAHVGPIQIVAPDSVDASSGGSYDTSTVSKDVWVVVTVTFGIDS